MTPDFKEAPVSQIPALRFLQQLGYGYLSPQEVAAEWRGGALFPSGYPSHPISEKRLIDSCYWGGTFEASGESPRRGDPSIGRLPAKYLSGRTRDAMETTFNAGSRSGSDSRNLEKQREYVDFGRAGVSYIIRFPACETRPMCELTANKPATPLHDAQLGGYFFARVGRKGGRA